MLHYIQWISSSNSSSFNGLIVILRHIRLDKSMRHHKPFLHIYEAPQLELLFELGHLSVHSSTRWCMWDKYLQYIVGRGPSNARRISSAEKGLGVTTGNEWELMERFVALSLATLYKIWEFRTPPLLYALKSPGGQKRCYSNTACSSTLFTIARTSNWTSNNGRLLLTVGWGILKQDWLNQLFHTTHNARNHKFPYVLKRKYLS